MALCISAHLTTTLWSLRPSSSSISESPSASLSLAPREDGASLTRETITHCATANATPTTAARGTSTWVATSDRIAMPGMELEWGPLEVACEEEEMLKLPRLLAACRVLQVSVSGAVVHRLIYSMYIGVLFRAETEERQRETEEEGWPSYYYNRKNYVRVK
jgi:hypothetical protein